MHVHHKPTIIKEEKTIKQEIHKPEIHITKEVEKPVVIHHHEEVVHHHKPEYKSPIYKEEISHEHLHHHYKVHNPYDAHFMSNRF